MRRPSPLPPARPRPAEEEAPVLAPIVPLAPVAAGGPTNAADAATGPVDPAAPTVPDAPAPVSPRPLSVRDVWAAARARRRALRREIRRFTQRQRRRRIAWLSVVAAVLVVALGALALAYSPLFAVREITVVGAKDLDPAVVAEALEAQKGTPLALVDSSEVKAALVAFPLVESYAVEARPPHELVVRIVERTPIGSVSSSAGHTLVDAAGVALATTPDPPAGYPVLTVPDGVGSRAFDAVGRVFRALPDDLRAQVTAISATTANDVTLTLAEADVLWGSADDSALKVVTLQSAMRARPADAVSVYDVSSPGAVVIR